MERSPVGGCLQAGFTHGSDDATGLWLLSFSWLHFLWIDSVLRPSSRRSLPWHAEPESYAHHMPTPTQSLGQVQSTTGLYLDPITSLTLSPTNMYGLRWGSGTSSEWNKGVTVVGWQTSTLFFSPSLTSPFYCPVDSSFSSLWLIFPFSLFNLYFSPSRIVIQLLVTDFWKNQITF